MGAPPLQGLRVVLPGLPHLLLLLLLTCAAPAARSAADAAVLQACTESCKPLVAGGVFNKYSKTSSEWSSSEITQAANSKLVSGHQRQSVPC